MLNQHCEQGADVTIACLMRMEATAFGVMAVDENSKPDYRLCLKNLPIRPLYPAIRIALVSGASIIPAPPLPIERKLRLEPTVLPAISARTFYR